MRFELNRYRALVAMCMVLTAREAQAQLNVTNWQANSMANAAQQNYNQGHLPNAQADAGNYLSHDQQRVGMGQPQQADDVRFVQAMSGLRRDEAGAPVQAAEARALTGDPAHDQRLSFDVARYHFRKEELADAIKYYEEAGIANLDNNEISDQKFELAYCYFNNKQFDKAKVLFASIKELKDSKYYMAGNYYYGLLCYNENKYDEALRSFDIVKNEREYRTIVPYYIAEIYYFKGNRDKALSIADSLIKSKEKSYYHKELHLLAGQCYFEMQDYQRTRPYFEYYYEHATKIRKEELYEIAYTYYQLNDWKNATEKFRMLSDASDSLGQTSMYLLGDCYLKAGNKKSARNAFGICASMPYNKGQQEAAMMLYARLSYETGNRDEALTQLNKLLTDFPTSRYRDEARTLLSDLLLKTNSYEDAIKQLNQVKNHDKEYQAVAQKASYGYAVQLMKEGELQSADDYFSRSLQSPTSSEYERAAYFWRAEIAYRNRNYNDAINYAQNFISRMGDIAVVEKISPQATVQHAYLTMGYSAMETGNYVAAQDYFNQAQLSKTNDKHSSSIALVQEADAVFMQKNYGKAIALYDKIIAGGGADAEYARYQKAVLLGLQNKNTEKLALLQEITKSKPVSPYASDAQYEMAVTYVEMDRYPQALATLKSLTDSSRDKSLLPKAWMKVGFIHQQMNENDKAIEAYRKVVVNYPGAEERFAALETLKGLYIQTNQPAAYSRLLKESNLPEGDNSSLDSTYYAAGEAQFSSGSWEQSRQAFNTYLASYPNGIFAVKAHYYRGESLYRMRKYKEALEDYNAVLATPWNDFSESSARRAATLAMDAHDYEQALRHYTALRQNAGENATSEIIYRGLMKSGYGAGHGSEAGAWADTLLAMPGISADARTDAMFVKAHTLQDAGKDDDAIAAYKELSAGNKSSEIAAESRYRIAEILLKENKLKEAEDAANETIKLSAGYDTWVGNAYLLLADILVKQEDYFNAKALLQSIIRNTRIAELKQQATQKLEEVRKAEKTKSKLSEE